MYVNTKRIEACVAIPLTDSDKICFGSAVPNNELKYRFFLRGGKAFLERTTDSFSGVVSPQHHSKPDSRGVKNCVDSRDPECTPPLVKTRRDVVKERPSVKKRLKLDPSIASDSDSSITPTLTTIVPPIATLPPTPPLPSLSPSASAAKPPLVDLESIFSPATSSQSSQVFSQVFSPHSDKIVSTINMAASVPQFQVVPSTQSTQGPALSSVLEPIQAMSFSGVSPLQASTSMANQDSNISKLGSQLGEVPATRTTPSVALVACGVNPSPALSTFSTKSTDKEVEDLFDDIVSNSDERLLEEAIFGESSTTNPQPASTTLPMDGATIQVLAVQDQMQQEKLKLLSSIEALKSELAAKNELITKQEKTNSDAGGVVTSMREEFTCVICQELFITAHTLSCSHSFCEVCIKEWMKAHKDCPICRKRSTTQPIRSLVLDNAIATVESKLSAEEKKERDATKEERKGQMGVKVLTTSHSVVVPTTSNPSTSGYSVHVVPGHTSASDVIVLDDDSETSSSESESDESSSDSSADYSGYGRCYHCGKCVQD